MIFDEMNLDVNLGIRIMKVLYIRALIGEQEKLNKVMFSEASVHRRVGYHPPRIRHPPRALDSPRTRHPPPTPSLLPSGTTKAGTIHPTGMLSC